MNFILQPWQILLVIIADWLHRERQRTIEFYLAQLKAMLAAQGKKQLLFFDEHRRLLAVKGKSLGKRALMELTTTVTPDTILRWHRNLVARKWDHTSDHPQATGRETIRQTVVELILRFARENHSWGYDRIQGALANVGYRISDTTVGNVLTQHGIEPAPDRIQRTTWSTFHRAHWDVLTTNDFTAVEVWNKNGLGAEERRYHAATAVESLYGATRNASGRCHRPAIGSQPVMPREISLGTPGNSRTAPTSVTV